MSPAPKTRSSGGVSLVVREFGKLEAREDGVFVSERRGKQHLSKVWPGMAAGATGHITDVIWAPEVGETLMLASLKWECHNLGVQSSAEGIRKSSIG